MIPGMPGVDQDALARTNRRILKRKLIFASLLALILSTCGIAVYSDLETDAEIREGR